MENFFDRLPAIPLVVNDPYFSIWAPADLPTQVNTCHWSGARKPICGYLTVDGKRFQFLGKDGTKAARVTSVRVMPTRTLFSMQAEGVQLDVTFWSPTLPDDLDKLSTPITFVDYALFSTDGGEHEVTVELAVSDMLCFDGEQHPALVTSEFSDNGLNICSIGQKQQKILCHSADRITIDWGYLYVASAQQVFHKGENTVCRWDTTAQREPKSSYILLGYDDIASIYYFGVLCQAWYTRNGSSLLNALKEFNRDHDDLLGACIKWDQRVLCDAEASGGDDYRLIVSAAWRQTFAAHKLIVTPDGTPALLSKENDSCGCIGTVDVSYPSAPIFLKYCPDLVNAMCAPVLRFASMPVWEYDFAPHDVGRYPYVAGQMYALRDMPVSGDVIPLIFQYPAGSDLYDPNMQMPLEECGNMIIMMEAAISFGAKSTLTEKYLPLLSKWADYLCRYGEDPNDQLCTDDFAGHLAHNANLSAKSMIAVACYARILSRFHRQDEAAQWQEKAGAMAKHWLESVTAPDGTSLTLDGKGWSLKYNLVWDRILDLGLLPEGFYREELACYQKRLNRFGAPLDNRADYTKSDWLCWIAAMAEKEQRSVFLAPVAKFLRTSNSRVPFSDWYDSLSGDYVSFIARSVQGGVFMPTLVPTPPLPQQEEVKQCELAALVRV